MTFYTSSTITDYLWHDQSIYDTGSNAHKPLMFKAVRMGKWASSFKSQMSVKMSTDVTYGHCKIL